MAIAVLATSALLTSVQAAPTDPAVGGGTGGVSPPNQGPPQSTQSLSVAVTPVTNISLTRSDTGDPISVIVTGGRAPFSIVWQETSALVPDPQGQATTTYTQIAMPRALTSATLSVSVTDSLGQTETACFTLTRGDFNGIFR